jgi:hypothetical protein
MRCAVIVVYYYYYLTWIKPNYHRILAAAEFSELTFWETDNLPVVRTQMNPIAYPSTLDGSHESLLGSFLPVVAAFQRTEKWRVG